MLLGREDDPEVPSEQRHGARIVNRGPSARMRRMRRERDPLLCLLLGVACLERFSRGGPLVVGRCAEFSGVLRCCGTVRLRNAVMVWRLAARMKNQARVVVEDAQGRPVHAHAEPHRDAVLVRSDQAGLVGLHRLQRGIQARRHVKVSKPADDGADAEERMLGQAALDLVHEARTFPDDRVPGLGHPSFCGQMELLQPGYNLQVRARSSLAAIPFQYCIFLAICLLRAALLRSMIAGHPQQMLIVRFRRGVEVDVPILLHLR
eukprot:scaffold8234_cov248-Pinguiococcus_pyrenoidosus.AAC.5